MGNIRIYPYPILRKKAQPIESVNGRGQDLADRMEKILYSNKGIGLAAPQIGILSQIIIVGF
jgi:peptide deformylase